MSNIPEIAGFPEVFRAEYKELRKRRARTMLDVVPADVHDPVPTVAHRFTGIALSGGGVRAAVFSLGVLQGLQCKRVVNCADYLSTVSGGGYIGTALTLAMSTNGGVFPFARDAEDPGETPEVRHLRDNSRYLLQNGVSSAISALVIYLRGIAMNIIVVLPFLLLGSAALVAFNPDTARLVSNHSIFGDLTSWVGQVALPLTFISSLVVFVLLLVYAISVSIFPILPLDERRRWARIAAVILAAYGIIFILEVHPWLLRAAFAYEGQIALPPEAGAQVMNTQLLDWLFAILKKIIVWVGPFVVVVFPFIKELAAKASADATGGWMDFAKRLASRAVLIFAAAVIPLALWLVMMQLAYWGTAVTACYNHPHLALERCDARAFVETWQHAPHFLQWILGVKETEPGLHWYHVPVRYASAALILSLIGLLLNVNANSLHQLYRDRLGSAFLVKRRRAKDDDLEPADLFRLTDMNGQAPYHLINTALNVPGSKFANRRGRNADFFLFSRCFVGSEATGYAPTSLAQEATDGLNIGTAMAISGAAAAPNMGMVSMRPLSPTIAFLNVRLGRWVRHPVDIVSWARSHKATAKPSWWFGKPGPNYLLREAFFKSGREITKVHRRRLRREGFVLLTDGGHIENLGIYELLRRRCALIIAVDGEADPDLDGGSLVQLERFARIDLDINIVMDWKRIGTRTREVEEEVKKKIVNPTAGPHVALGLIDYPPVHDGSPREKGVLVYIKASLSGDENDYVIAYKSAHTRFPHETTLDQFFSEEQFEVYRALGEHIARRFLDGRDPAAAAAVDRDELLAMVRTAIPGATPV
jgi:Patatin-like phospholipase